MPVARLNDTELFYADLGEGLPCLLMHGGLGEINAPELVIVGDDVVVCPPRRLHRNIPNSELVVTGSLLRHGPRVAPAHLMKVYSPNILT